MPATVVLIAEKIDIFFLKEKPAFSKQLIDATI